MSSLPAIASADAQGVEPSTARPLAIVLAVLALLYAMRLAIVWQLARDGVGLHVDEAQYWGWSRELALGYYSKPPLIALLIAASTALFGDGVAGVKALPMLCYPVTALVLYRLGREMADARTGVLAALLFASTPLAALLGLAATTDAPLLLAWTLALWCLWHAWQRPNPWAWVLLGAAVGLALLSKYSAAAFVFTAAGFAWSERRGGVPLRPRLAGLAVAAAVAVLVLAPNVLWNAAHGWPTWRHTAEITVGASSRGGLAGLESVSEFALGQLLVIGPLTAVWAMWLSWQPRRPRGAGESSRAASARRLALWSAAPPLLLGLLQAAHAHAEINWAAPAAPGAALWVALAARRGRASMRWLAACMAAHIAFAGAAALAAHWPRAAGRALPAWLDAWARMRGWDSAFDALRPAIAARAPVLIVGTSRAVHAQGGYQLRGLPIEWAAWSPDGRVHDHYQLTRPLPENARGPLLLLGEDAPSPALRARFAELRPLQRVRVPVNDRRAVELQLWEASGVGAAR